VKAPFPFLNNWFHPTVYMRHLYCCDSRVCLSVHQFTSHQVSFTSRPKVSQFSDRNCFKAWEDFFLILVSTARILPAIDFKFKIKHARFKNPSLSETQGIYSNIDLVWLYQYRIQGVPGGMCQTSGECSLGQIIPI